MDFIFSSRKKQANYRLVSPQVRATFVGTTTHKEAAQSKREWNEFDSILRRNSHQEWLNFVNVSGERKNMAQIMKVFRIFVLKAWAIIIQF